MVNSRCFPMTETTLSYPTGLGRITSDPVIGLMARSSKDDNDRVDRAGSGSGQVTTPIPPLLERRSASHHMLIRLTPLGTVRLTAHPALFSPDSRKPRFKSNSVGCGLTDRKQKIIGYALTTIHRRVRGIPRASEPDQGWQAGFDLRPVARQSASQLAQAIARQRTLVAKGLKALCFVQAALCRLLKIAQRHGRLQIVDDRLPLLRRQAGQSRVETGIARTEFGELSLLQ